MNRSCLKISSDLVVKGAGKKKKENLEFTIVQIRTERENILEKHKICRERAFSRKWPSNKAAS